MRFESGLDRAPSDFVAQIGQCSLDSSVAPISVLHGHADHQPSDLISGPQTSGATLPAAIIFPGQDDRV